MIEGYVYDLLGPEAGAAFLPVVGHTLIETAVDILVRRCVDPLAGARLYLAANNRSDEVPLVLAGVFGSIQGCPKPREFVKAEKSYRQQMMQYGQLFLLPEPQLIEQLSTQTIGLAQMFLHDVLAWNTAEISQLRSREDCRIHQACDQAGGTSLPQTAHANPV